MIEVRPAAERGRTVFDWLDSWHSFSFGEYRDPAHMGFSVLRVINEDFVKPGTGFGMHGHRDMEIITWVLSGELQHRDSLGNGSVIRPGDAQRMSAGTGIRHSEANASQSETVHLLQIWILPALRDIAPGYEQRAIPMTENGWTLIASRDGREGSVTLHQDAALYVARPQADDSIGYTLAAGRAAWLQIARGRVVVNGQKLNTGDGAAVSNETRLAMTAQAPSEVLLFDLPEVL